MKTIWNNWLKKLNINDLQKVQLEEIINFLNTNYSFLNIEIKWNQPMFCFNKTFIIAFSVAKNHIAISPEAFTINKFKKEIFNSGYEYTSNIFKIKSEQKINWNLLKEILDFNIQTKKDCKTFFRKDN